jgi:hypothetical protein
MYSNLNGHKFTFLISISLRLGEEKREGMVNDEPSHRTHGTLYFSFMFMYPCTHILSHGDGTKLYEISHAINKSLNKVSGVTRYLMFTCISSRYMLNKHMCPAHSLCYCHGHSAKLRLLP